MPLNNAGDTIGHADFINKAHQDAVPANDVNRVPKLESDGKLHVDFTFPVGFMMDWPAATPPSGFLVRDGAAVSRSTYAALFALIGTAFGAGNGSTTFNLPNDKGRGTIGYDSAQTEFDTIGKQGGEKTHLLTEAEMPAHVHGANSQGGTDNSNGPYLRRDGGSDGALSGVITSTGGGGAHNNLHPYTVYLPIIKY